MKNRLLDNILYGNEQAELDDACPALRRAHQAHVPDGEAGDWAEVVALTRRFFRNRGGGVFGGPITAGDAVFIAAFMARVRPVRMIEVGVASGFPPPSSCTPRGNWACWATMSSCSVTTSPQNCRTAMSWGSMSSATLRILRRTGR